MARPKTRQTKKRLNLETTEEVRERMESLRDATGAESITQMLARAVAVYELVVNEQSKGGSVLIRSADGREREVLLIP